MVDVDNGRKRAAMALLAMQRYSWEQGAAIQAFLEMGEKDIVLAMAHEAVYRSIADGRAAIIGGDRAVTDPCCVGEALLEACRWTQDPFLEKGRDALLDWALHKAPRSEKGVLYHLETLKEFWVDSLYMLPPFLAAAGYMKEALLNFRGYVERLYDREAHLMGHRWDEEKQEWVRRAHWGTGNGWTLAAIARMIPVLRRNGYEKEAGEMKLLAEDLLDHLLPLMRQDGLFYDVVDEPDTFVEVNLSQMTAYTIYRGVSESWLSVKYLPSADKMRQAAMERRNAYGFIEGVCGAPGFDKPGFSPEGQAFYLLMEQAYQNAAKVRGDSQPDMGTDVKTDSRPDTEKGYWNGV